MQAQSTKYTMRISRLTIDKLGIQMYDRVSAVLAELIANAYDADAENVSITLPFGEYLARQRQGQLQDQGFEIVVEDDGCGMTADEVNEYYLNVGYNRRAGRSEETPRYGRRVMGRKGIGKLAPFGICYEVEVITAGGKLTADGYLIANLILDLPSMLDEQYDEEGNPLPYHPQPGRLDGNYAERSGTKLIMRRFGRKRVPSGEDLNRQLAGRFGLSRPDWSVSLANSLAESESMEVGTLDVDLMEGTYIDVSDRPVITPDGQHLAVTGWVAYAKDSYRDEVMAGVRFFARGKIVCQTRDFDIKSGFTGEFKMRSYLTGAIHAEWLDDEDDLVSTDRQDIIWNSEAGNALLDWGRELLKELARKASTSTARRAWDVFLEESQLEERLASSSLHDLNVRNSVLRAAKSLVTRADRDSIKDEAYRERMVNLAFAIGPYRMLLETLDNITASESAPADVILDLFERAAVVEAYALGQIARERVESIEQLRRLISERSTSERQLQVLIEGAQWILYPDWTPLSQNQRLTTTRANFETWYRAKYGVDIVTSTIGNPTKQPDFVMLNHEGRIEVVEIKRPQYALPDAEFRRAVDYLTAVTDFIKETDEVKKLFAEVRLTIVCDDLDLSSFEFESLAANERIIHKTWHDLLQAATRSNEDFLAEVQRLQGVIPPLVIEDESV